MAPKEPWCENWIMEKQGKPFLCFRIFLLQQNTIRYSKNELVQRPQYWHYFAALKYLRYKEALFRYSE
jgi:hypothetical protein